MKKKWVPEKGCVSEADLTLEDLEAIGRWHRNLERTIAKSSKLQEPAVRQRESK